MNLIEFNTKVNLERFLKIQGLQQYEARPHPYVGWLAYRKDNGECMGLIYDLFDPSTACKLYASMAQNHPEVFDVGVIYHKKCDWNFQVAVKNYFLWRNIFILARKEMRHQVAWTKDVSKKGSFEEYLTDQGYTGYIENGFGVVTDELLKRYPDIVWPDICKGHKRIFVPYWIAPTVLGGLEVCKVEEPHKRVPVFTLDKKIPKGWCGIVSSPIAENVTDLATQKAMVWSPHALPFIRQPIEFGASVQAETFMNVCSSSTTLNYAEPPANTMAVRNFEEGLIENLHKLRKGSLDRLELTLGMPLTEAWLASRRGHTYLGNRRFLKRPDGYFEVTNDGYKQICDFTIDIDHYEVRNDQVRVHLEVIRDSDTYAIVAPHDVLSKSNFIFKMRDLLLRNGVSAVDIDPAYGRILPDLITKFSPAVRLDYVPAVEVDKLKKTSREEIVVKGNDAADESATKEKI